LVTGGAGFIGVHSVELLLAEGYDVAVVDDLRHRSWRPLPDTVEVLELDICSPEAKQAVVGFAPDAILHLAAQGGVNRSWRDPLFDATNNVLGTLNVISAAAEAECPRLVIASSGGALYGDASALPTPEDSTYAPRSPYGTSKLAGEAYLGTYSRIRGLAGLALRYGNVYGPGQDGSGEAGVVAITCHRLLQGSAPQIRGDGSQTRDFIFVGDVARANLAALRAEITGAVNVGTGVETAVAELVDTLVACSDVDVAPEQTELPPGEVRRSCLDVTRAATEMGFRTQTSLGTGLSITWKAFSEGARVGSVAVPTSA
jgi:UDP-glucose 4-epimerase